MDESLSSPGSTPATPQEAREEWENEGGGAAPRAADALPDGITARQVTEYFVGAYRYTDLASAKAELARQTRRQTGRSAGDAGALQNKS